MAVNYNAEPILTVKGLKQYFKVSSTFTVKAVDDVSFDIYPGETYGLVGESGSGKSTIGRSVIRLYDPTAGEIHFNGRDISGKLSKADNQALRTQMQMIFQDPMTFLNPILKIGIQMTEGIRKHQNCSKKEAEAKAIELMRQVGIPSPEKRLDQYPFEFSGGMRQRIIIATALACDPKLIIAEIGRAHV